MTLRVKAYQIALLSCETATLEDLDAVIHDIVCGLPAPLEFAPTSGRLARMVRDKAAQRWWKDKQAGNVKVLDVSPDDPVISPKEQKRRVKMLEKLSGQLADVTHARKM